jgi:hypothetical protein
MMRMGICRGEIVTRVLDVCLDYTQAQDARESANVNTTDTLDNDVDNDNIVTHKKTDTLTSFLAQFQTR